MTRIDRRVMWRAASISLAVATMVLGSYFLLRDHDPSTPSILRDHPAASQATTSLATASGRVRVASDGQQRSRAATDLKTPLATAGTTPPEPMTVASPPSVQAQVDLPDPPASDLDRPAFVEPAATAADAADEPAASDSPALGGQEPAGMGDIVETGAGTQEGRIKTSIHLRAAPRSGAAILATLAAGTRVTVHSCRFWCEVDANGKRGFVVRQAVKR